MSDFVLSPQVIKEATSYNPFKNITPDVDTAEFEEDAYFEGANLKNLGEQSIVEVSLRIAENSAQGNAGVKFRTDVWLNNAICAGTIRPKDAEDRDWKGTKAALRTLNNLAGALGIKTENPVTALTAMDAPQGLIHVRIRIFRANSGQHKWELNRVSRIKA